MKVSLRLTHWKDFLGAAMTDRYGAQFERDVLQYLRDEGQVAERLRLTGKEDEGDIVLWFDGGEYVCQLKANRSANTSASLGARLRDAETQAEAYRAHRNLKVAPVPALVIKNPRKPIGSAFVVMRLDEFIGARDA